MLSFDGLVSLLGERQTGATFLDELLSFQLFDDAVNLCLLNSAFGIEPAEVSGDVGLGAMGMVADF